MSSVPATVGNAFCVTWFHHKVFIFTNSRLVFRNVWSYILLPYVIILVFIIDRLCIFINKQ
jgi:hypothetical protein